MLETNDSTISKDIPIVKDKNISNPTVTSESNDTQKTKTKKSVKFNNVEVYLFERTQGFQSIPSDTSENIITLGMTFAHQDQEEYKTIEDHLKHKRVIHLEKIEREISNELASNCDGSDASKSALSEEDPAYLSKLNDILSQKKYYEDNIDIDFPINMDLFCPILNNQERVEKLAELGFPIEQLDNNESQEINEIKKSRLLDLGCKCKKMNKSCSENGDLCSCSANGIMCQLDKTRFPCECSLTRCQNPNGIKRFDQKSVFKHCVQVLSNQNLIRNEVENPHADGNPIVKSKAKKRKRKNSKSKNNLSTSSKKYKKNILDAINNDNDNPSSEKKILETKIESTQVAVENVA